MKVFLLDLWRVINSKGGTEKVFFSMANALDERGYEVVAVGLDNKDYDRKYYQRCRRQIDNYKLQGHISFCGTTDNVKQQMSRAKFCVYPSAYEGFCLALTECMSYALPAIGYKNCQL